ncbi:hypothetical protein BJP37_16990 [Moorena bouillonii PNG]|uniref:Uncharacterized protein n=1 Tax=Moorena bouillonii PNG TaxID=568701 RepID=A0A1U7N3C9_9CYAN|nr:hypothetical protein BJP37_16990 [Moorena bouillonii PNG]
MVCITNLRMREKMKESMDKGISQKSSKLVICLYRGGNREQGTGNREHWERAQKIFWCYYESVFGFMN